MSKAELIKKIEKALKDGIWTKGGYYDPCYLDAEPKFVEGKELRIGITYYDEADTKGEYVDKYNIENQECLCIFAMSFEIEVYVTRLEDYGKTWALTEKELK